MYQPQVFHPVLEILEDRTAFAVDVVTSPAAAPAAPMTTSAPAQQAPAPTPAGQGTSTQATNAQAASGQTNNGQFANGQQTAGSPFFNGPFGATQGTNAFNPNAQASGQFVNGQFVVNGQLVNGQTAAGVGTSGFGAGVLREFVPQPSPVQELGSSSATEPNVEDYPPASFVNQGPPPPTAQAPPSYPGRIVFSGTGVQQRVAFGTGPFTQQPGLYLQGGGGGDEQIPLPHQRRLQPQLPQPAASPTAGVLLIGPTEDGAASGAAQEQSSDSDAVWLPSAEEAP